MKGSIISSDWNWNDVAYLRYLLLLFLSALTFQMSDKIEGMKHRAYTKYLEGYRLKSKQVQ
ncbi:hypothetical protein ASD24_19745 [Paenibacillus sp. Root52]|nr:hypothetical protein ASD24_19745 [Paenibacillus sp. Root52]